MLDSTNRIGIVRNLDHLGRIVIPVEYRKQLHIKESEPMEIIATESGIFIRKISARSVTEILDELRCAVQDTPELQSDANIMQELEKIGALISETYSE